MKQIELTQGRFVLVSDEDYVDVCKFKWYYANLGHGCAVRTPTWKDTFTGKWKKRIYFLHNFIGEYLYGPLAEGFYFDHINRDPLDNRRENLRICQHWQNCHNRKNGSYKKKTSGLPVGVFRNGKSGNYFAHLKAKGIRYRSPSFPTIEEAEAAYKAFQKQYVGQFALKESDAING